MEPVLLSSGARQSSTRLGAGISTIRDRVIARSRDGATLNRRTRISAPRREALTLPPLWQLLVVQLNPDQFDYTPADVAELVGTEDQSVRRHCRNLWPNRQGRFFRLEFDEVVQLICRVCRDGQRLPDRQHLYQELLQQHIITPNFPQDSPAVLRAIAAVQRARATR